MSIINIVKKVKMVYPEFVVLVKMGEFYHAYGRDSYIIASLLDYKLKTVDEDYYTVRISDKKFK